MDFSIDLTSAAFWNALIAIILIDLMLAGDNAIMIALAARGLPKKQQEKAIIWGTAGAIIVRILLTFIVTWLLRIPGLQLVGGLALLFIAVKLLMPPEAIKPEQHASSASFWQAMKTIVIADALMGLDNVLAIAGAAHGNFVLIVIGLLISIPIVVYGSSLVIKLIDRFPIIVVGGAILLAYIAAKMIFTDPIADKLIFVDNASANELRYALTGLVVSITVGYGVTKARKKTKAMKRAAAKNNVS